MPERLTTPARLNGSPTWRIALLVFIVASIVWLGAINIRAIIGNELLKPGTVEFDDFINPQAEREVYRLISIVSVSVMVGYAVATLGSIVFLVTCPFSIKEHGWLLMSAILFYVFVPVEVYTLSLDWKMMYLEFYTTADIHSFRTLFRARIMALQGVPLIALFCYYSIVVLAIFQPLRRRRIA
jgi:hypothetical protein